MDKKKCSSCGEAPHKCSCKNKEFTKAVIEIDNPEQITLMRKVVIPASMGDDTTVPPVVGKYHNVLLYYEANQKSYLYSSDGIPTQLVNGVTDYEAAINLPQINGNTLIGDKTGEELGLQDKLTAGDNITIENDIISATDTTYGPATDTEIGLVKPGDGLEVNTNGTMSISDIEQYAHFFDTVADMKAATNLVAGDYVRTLGYYAKDDTGGAYYKVSSTAPSGYYETLASGLYAELIPQDTMNVRQFGAKGDGVADDTAAIQNAMDVVRNAIVPDGVYMVNAVTQLKPNTGNKIELSNNATIKAIANDSGRYAIIRIDNVNNIEISGGAIEGDRLAHIGSSGEWGYGIQITGSSSNIFIHDITIKNTWGDGLGVTTSGDVTTENVHVDNARRNGYSIIRVNNFISNNDFIENTNGTNPQSGVDIEPDLSTETLNNVVFNNLHTKNSANIGFQCYLRFENTNLYDHIKVNNLFSEDDLIGVWVDSFNNHNGEVSFDSPTIIRCKNRGIFIRARGTNFSTMMYRPTINTYGVESPNAHGIDIEGYNYGEASTMGLIRIVEPTIINGNAASTNPVAINIASTANTTYTSLDIINPLDLDNKFINFNAAMVDSKIIDTYNVISKAPLADSVIGGNDAPFITYTQNYSTLNQIRISGVSKFPIGTRLKFVNDGNYGIKIYFQNQYIYGITNDVNKTVTSTTRGAYLEILRISDTEWTVVSSSGVFTTN